MTPKIELCRLVVQGREEDSSSYARSDYAIKTQGRMLPVILSFDSMDDACEWLDWAQSRAAVYTLQLSRTSTPIDSPAWLDIRESDTLNVRGTKGDKDTKHICPLQLGVIRRLIRLYTNPGEIVFSPFAGIGSEGYCALQLDRRFYGCEIKDEYIAAARENIGNVATEKQSQALLF